MGALARLQAADCANPVLDLYTSVNGTLTDVYAVSYQIFDKTTGSPVQVFPATPGDKAPVDVTHDCPSGGRLSVGRYVAVWTPGAAEPLGTHQIKWFFQLTSSTPEQTFIEEFEVLSVVGGSSLAYNYVTVADMRDEGVPSSVTDDWLKKRIALASRFFEAATKRWFYPKDMVLVVDGKGGTKILLQQPIIHIASITFETAPFYPSSLEIDFDLLKIYNRHLTEGLIEPDDRNNPKIEMFHPAEAMYADSSYRQRWGKLIFPDGVQNIAITGTFGYTDPDPDEVVVGGGFPKGKVPDMVQHAVKLLVMRELDKMSRTAARFDAHNRHRLTSERTRDQAYTLEALGTLRGASFTGDPEIDNLIAYFQAPPRLGAA